MYAKTFQKQLANMLKRHYEEVRSEWSVSKDATDSMRRDPKLYAPRVDIAIGPFNTTPGRGSDIKKSLLTTKFQSKLAGLIPNTNPRCLLAIEVTFSGSSKHIIGDIINASALGLYGIVVGRPEIIPKIERNLKYLEELGKIDKSPVGPKNLLVLSTKDFRKLF